VAQTDVRMRPPRPAVDGGTYEHRDRHRAGSAVDDALDAALWAAELQVTDVDLPAWPAADRAAAAARTPCVSAPRLRSRRMPPGRYWHIGLIPAIPVHGHVISMRAAAFHLGRIAGVRVGVIPSQCGSLATPTEADTPPT